MQRLYIERFYLNRADDEYHTTVRIIRYPYLCVKLGVERDADGSEHYVYHDNPRPWKVSGCRQPVCLCSEEANEHLMAFSWWDDCVALDFFHALIDGTAAYRILKTLLYEYCRRRYDSELDPAGVWVAGDIVPPFPVSAPCKSHRPSASRECASGTNRYSSS